ncbi:unnamed protein product [Effrenium voratum]|uniref:Fe2OG dioxygenase domain-containing protein n=1 Tax=Effrenium voratum TaxID=2562239 RepID=A0AA36J028_9DINO|nr:unnamed protein product [Effrenium voratum]
MARVWLAVQVRFAFSLRGPETAWWRREIQIQPEGSLKETLAGLAKTHISVRPSPDIEDQLILLHADPAVLLIPNLWRREACEQLIAVARGSGAMRQSHATGVSDAEAQALRTSGSVVITPDITRRFGAERLVRKLFRDLAVLGVGGPQSGYGEFPQVVRYERGQHFAEHQDAFNWEQVQQDGYQRQATFLLYLNDVEKGGATRFPELGIDVQPRCGQGLLFFPAFKDGRQDVRTAHSAEAAVDEKWIVQVWKGKLVPSPRR